MSATQGLMVQSDRDDYNVQNNSVGDKPCKKTQL